jgi:hypothetical protein
LTVLMWKSCELRVASCEFDRFDVEKLRVTGCGLRV